MTKRLYTPCVSGPRTRRDSPVSRELGHCPCCGYRTLSPGAPGSYEVCPVCGWLDDLVGFHHPSVESDYNYCSLRKARRNVGRYGAAIPERVDETRDPCEDEPRDPNWPYD